MYLMFKATESVICLLSNKYKWFTCALLDFLNVFWLYVAATTDGTGDRICGQNLDQIFNIWFKIHFAHTTTTWVIEHINEQYLKPAKQKVLVSLSFTVSNLDLPPFNFIVKGVFYCFVL